MPKERRNFSGTEKMAESLAAASAAVATAASQTAAASLTIGQILALQGARVPAGAMVNFGSRARDVVAPKYGSS